MKRFVAAAAVATLGLGLANASTTVFEETWDLDASTNGAVRNFNGFANWTVTDGFVDLVPDGAFFLRCNGGTGGCLDSDGSMASASGMTIETNQIFSFDAGRAYTLSVTFSGNQRGGSDTLNFEIAGLLDEFVPNIAASAPFTTMSYTFTPTLDTLARIMISLPGPLDFVGPILDDVRLTVAGGTNPIPVPAALPLFLAGAGAFGAVKRRKAG